MRISANIRISVPMELSGEDQVQLRGEQQPDGGAIKPAPSNPRFLRSPMHWNRCDPRVAPLDSNSGDLIQLRAIFPAPTLMMP